jgi:hypothetical protein
VGVGVGKEPKTRDFLLDFEFSGGDGGIRTLDRALQPYNGLANRRLQPLGHVSGQADMPDRALSRKRQMSGSVTSPVQIDSGTHGGPNRSVISRDGGSLLHPCRNSS